MKTALTYEELMAENASMKAEAETMKETEKTLRMRIAYLERMLYGRTGLPPITACGALA